MLNNDGRRTSWVVGNVVQALLHVILDNEILVSNRENDLKTLKLYSTLLHNRNDLIIESDISQVIDLKIVDCLGKLRYTQNQTLLNPGKNSVLRKQMHLPIGVYFVEMQAKGSRSFVDKFVVQ